MSIKRLILLSLLAAAVACGVLPAGAERAQEFDLLGRVAVPLDGTDVCIDTEGIRYRDLRIVVEGSVRCDRGGTTYFPTKELQSEWGVIKSSATYRAELLESESMPERAVLLWPEGARDWPGGIHANVDTRVLGKRLGIAPTDVPRHLSGHLTLEVWVSREAGENPLAFTITWWDVLVAILWRAWPLAVLIAAVAAGLRVWRQWRHTRQ